MSGMGGSGGRHKKTEFLATFFEFFDFGHLFLSILKKMKKGCQKILQKTTCDHYAFISVF
jgi:hypothetical protein